MTRQRSRFNDQSQTANRRSGFIPGRRFALALSLLFLGPFGGVALANENAGQQVTAQVYSPNRVTADSVSIGYLQAHPATCPTYPGPNPVGLHGSNGQLFEAVGFDGQLAWSLATVLGCLQNPVNVNDVTGVTVTGFDGAPELSEASQLALGDLLAPSNFSNTSEVPMIFSDGDNITYLRPWRGGSDDNYADTVTDPDPSPMFIQVFEGQPLIVAATASALSVAAGASVSFSAIVQGTHPGLTYSWDFDGGAPDSAAPSPTVRFASAGSYDVTLQVTDAAGGGGGYAFPTPLTVGSAATSQTPTTPSAPPSGPTHSAGHTPGAAAGKQSRKPAAGSGDHHHNKAAAGATVSSTPSTTPNTTAAATTPGADTAPKPKRPTTRTASHSTARARAPVARHPPPASPGETSVAGRLVSGLTPLPPDESPLVHSQQPSTGTAPSMRRVVAAPLLSVSAAALTVVFLFSLGAGRELRGRRRWRGLRFGG